MSLLLLLRRRKPHPVLRPWPSPPFCYHATTSPSSRLLSTKAEAPAPNPQFATDYLIRSCGLPSDDAVRASKYIRHLKSPDRPDAVLRFLRQIGITESHITTAVSRDARILCCKLDNNLRPNVAKLQEVGLSIEDISSIISRSPGVFHFNFAPKIDFWMGLLGSAKNLSVALKRCGVLLGMNMEKVILPNLSFLQDQCGLSACQIIQLIKSGPRLITVSTEAMKMKAKRADELGVSRSSASFLYALIVISRLKQHIIDARINNLTSLGLSQAEVTTLVSRLPLVLTIPEEMMGRKMEFLVKEASCDKLYVVQTPCLLTYSLEKRLIPRSLVWKLLEFKGLPVAKKKFASFVVPSEERFLKVYILPYESVIPGLLQAYKDVCAGSIERIKWFKSISS